MNTYHVATNVHGRFLHESRDPARLLVGFHGYAETAEMHMAELQKIPGAGEWSLAAVQALDRDPYVPQDRLDITVSDARVTLSGEVNWEYQRYAAVVDVMRLIGAKDVINGITVASPLH